MKAYRSLALGCLILCAAAVQLAAAAGHEGHKGHGSGSGSSTSTGSHQGHSHSGAHDQSPFFPEPLPDLPKTNDGYKFRVYLEDRVKDASLAAVCKGNASKTSMPCELREMCKAEGFNASAVLCGTTSIAGMICRDKESAVLYKENQEAYINLCNETKTVCVEKNCQRFATGWPNFPNFAQVKKAFEVLCYEGGHYMEACGRCMNWTGKPVSTPTKKDLVWQDNKCHAFRNYVSACLAMPQMNGCQTWYKTCRALPVPGKGFPRTCNFTHFKAAAQKFDPNNVPKDVNSAVHTGMAAASVAIGVLSAMLFLVL